MKKFITLIMSVVIIASTICAPVNAESIGIKKIDSTNNGYYVLLENGVLVEPENPQGEYGITPRTKPKTVAENVSDFTIESGGFLTVLFHDGTLTRKYDTHVEGIDYTIDNVSQMLSERVYLKNGVAYYKNYSTGKDYAYENIKKLLSEEYNGVYALDNNDTLFKCIGGEKIKIADDVLAFNEDKLIFNKNNEILSFDLNGTSVQLTLLTDEVSYENFCANNFITNDNRFVEISQTKATVLDKANNVKRTLADAGTAYYLSTDDKLIEYKIKYNTSGIIYKEFEGYVELFNGETFKHATKTYLLNTNNELYSTSDYGHNNKRQLIDTDVDKVLFDKPLIYQKNNGEIYCTSNNKPYLYPLAQKQTKLILNKNEIELKDNIQTKDGRSMYPFRAILEAMGASVMWDSRTETAIGTLNGNRVEFKVGTNEYAVNGETKYMDTQSYVDDLTDRTYIPIRYAAEALGFKVDWKPGSKEDTITLTK